MAYTKHYNRPFLQKYYMSYWKCMFSLEHVCGLVCCRYSNQIKKQTKKTYLPEGSSISVQYDDLAEQTELPVWSGGSKLKLYKL